jgi:TPR repeat protein
MKAIYHHACAVKILSLGNYDFDEDDPHMEDVVEWLKLASEAGSSRAAFHLGWIYMDGLGGIAADQLLAVQYWELAARQEHEGACFRLGAIYQNGTSAIPENTSRAIECYEVVLKLVHHTDAALNLAHIYGYSKDPEIRSIENYKFYLQYAAKFGNTSAWIELGMLAELESNDSLDAVQCYERAWALGDCNGAWCLGVFYQNRDNKRSYDEIKSLGYFQQLADCGSSHEAALNAMIFIGADIYICGQCNM